MNFKYSAFIENTEEAREWLESIGYEPCSCVDDDPGDLIFTNHTRGKFHGYDEEVYGDILAEREEAGGDEVDCRGNFELFKAVTALRDDSDYMQWFVSEYREFKLSKFDTVPNWDYDDETDGMIWHKASLKKLINHFKK